MPIITLAGPLGSGLSAGAQQAPTWAALGLEAQRAAANAEDEQYRRETQRRLLEHELRTQEYAQRFASDPQALQAARSTPLVPPSPLPGVQFDTAMSEQEFLDYLAVPDKDRPRFLLDTRTRKAEELFAAEASAATQRLTQAVQAGSIPQGSEQEILAMLTDNDPTSARAAWAALDMAEQRQTQATAAQSEIMDAAQQAQDLVAQISTLTSAPEDRKMAMELAGKALSTNPQVRNEALMQLRVAAAQVGPYVQEIKAKAEAALQQERAQNAELRQWYEQYRAEKEAEARKASLAEERARLDKAHGTGEMRRRGIRALANAIGRRESPESIQAILERYGLEDGPELNSAVRQILQGRKPQPAPR